jgi:pimeloyl-ACP methyl ester carboxylesterase
MEKRTLSTAAGPVHIADFGGQGQPVVLVHGLGGSYTNWMCVGAALAARARVVAPDLLGFGRTPLAGREPSVAGNVALVGHVLDELGASARKPAVLIGNSMGGLVSMLTAAARPDVVSSLVLVGAALPRPMGPMDLAVAALFTLYAIPGVGELFLRRRLASAGPERVLRDTLRMCGVDPRALPADVWDEALALAVDRAGWAWSNHAFLGAARSMLRTLARRGRVHESMRRVRARTLVVQGAEDQLVPPAVSEAAVRVRPDWRLTVMPGVGHVPQLQVPGLWLGIVNAWLDEGAR